MSLFPIDCLSWDNGLLQTIEFYDTTILFVIHDQGNILQCFKKTPHYLCMGSGSGVEEEGEEFRIDILFICCTH